MREEHTKPCRIGRGHIGDHRQRAFVGHKLSNYIRQHARLLHQSHRSRGIGRAAKADKLDRHALPRDAGKSLSTCRGCRKGCGLDRKSELCRKAKGAQNTERVLSKAQGRLAHSAKRARRKVGLTAKGIDQASVGVIRHRVDGKIAARKILGDAVGKADRIGMSPVGIVAVTAEGRDLDRLSRKNDRHRSVLEAGFDHTSIRKYAKRFFGKRRGRNIKIMCGKSKQRIAQASAYDIRFFPCSRKTCKHLADVCGISNRNHVALLSF